MFGVDGVQEAPASSWLVLRGRPGRCRQRDVSLDSWRCSDDGLLGCNVQEMYQEENVEALLFIMLTQQLASRYALLQRVVGKCSTSR